VPIFLIRHGETEANASRIMQTPEVPLSERGLAQAERLAARLADAGVTRILASDLSRAERTARALAGATGAPVELDPLLQERSFGDWRGRPYAEIGRDPFAADALPPGGESWGDFHARVDRAWERVLALAASEAVLAVVTHGLVKHSVAARRVDLPPGVPRPGRDGPPLRFGNTALTRIVGPGPWRVELLGCVAHLPQEAAAGAAVPPPGGAPA